MGEVRGDVDVLGISNLLQMLSMNGCKGFLTIHQESQKKVLHFMDEGIRLVAGARRTNPLGEILIRTGKLTRDQLDELLAEQRRTGMPLGEIVQLRGILTKSVIESALREQVSEEVYDLFTWEDARFIFGTGADAQPPADSGPLAGVILDANMMSLMIEAARRVDELARIQSVIPDVRLVAERLELPASLDDPGLDRNAIEDVLPLVDGERSVGHIIEESLFPKFTVLRTLYGLAQRGVIKIKDKGDTALRSKTVLRRPPTRMEDRPSPRGRTVLLLSDLPTFRAALALCLRSEGFDAVEGAASELTPEGLAALAADVIVLDVPIETDDGLKLCANLREKTKTPFLVLSGNTSKQAIAHALQSGARYVLIKPVKEDLLLERISNVLKG
jgi:CheY-like chemotaxis protein